MSYTHKYIIYTVELGYDVMKGIICVVLHECYYHLGYNIMVKSEELIGIKE